MSSAGGEDQRSARHGVLESGGSDALRRRLRIPSQHVALGRSRACYSARLTGSLLRPPSERSASSRTGRRPAAIPELAVPHRLSMRLRLAGGFGGTGAIARTLTGALA